MLFHQMQLMVCAVIAKRWGRQAEAAAPAAPAATVRGEGVARGVLVHGSAAARGDKTP